LKNRIRNELALWPAKRAEMATEFGAGQKARGRDVSRDGRFLIRTPTEQSANVPMTLNIVRYHTFAITGSSRKKALLPTRLRPIPLREYERTLLAEKVCVY
jgi:hypothetical protein